MKETLVVCFFIGRFVGDVAQLVESTSFCKKFGKQLTYGHVYGKEQLRGTGSDTGGFGGGNL